MKDRFCSFEESLQLQIMYQYSQRFCWVVLGPRKAFDRMIEYFRGQVIGVLRLGIGLYRTAT